MNRQFLCVLIGTFLAISVAVAQTTIDQGLGCPNIGAFTGGILAETCWNCVLPIRIAGVPFGGLPTNVPLGAASSACICPGRLFGTPTPGVTLGMWQPRHIVEIVRKPYCSPTLGTSMAGSVASLTTSEWGGYTHNDDNAFYQFHIFLYPAALIFDQMEDAVCVSHAGSDMDLLFMSEIDPTWNNDELSLYTTPEAILFANPAAISACVADAAQATAYQPDPLLFWCAGSWGTLYPFTGHTTEQGDMQRDASLTLSRGLAMTHRFGLLDKTMGDDAVCHSHPDPVLPRNQYKLQTMWPIPELGTNHWIGQNAFTWGEFRNIPVVGEDFVYTAFSWVDCCANE
jgi:conjugal transfer pilus assembly protein TraU